MRIRHKSWARPFLDAHPEVVLEKDGLSGEEGKAFLLPQQLCLEIGAGRGDFILNLAHQNPNMNFLAVEMNIDALAVATKKIVASGLPNVRVIYADIQSLFENLPPNIFKYIFLNFSDPWPKKRHEKRRLTYPSALAGYRKLLLPLGELRLKTDNHGLFCYSLEKLQENNWIILEVNEDYNGKEMFDAQSEYEQKFRTQGVKIHRLVARKE